MNSGQFLAVMAYLVGYALLVGVMVSQNRGSRRRYALPTPRANRVTLIGTGQTMVDPENWRSELDRAGR